MQIIIIPNDTTLEEAANATAYFFHTAITFLAKTAFIIDIDNTSVATLTMDEGVFTLMLPDKFAQVHKLFGFLTKQLPSSKLLLD